MDSETVSIYRHRDGRYVGEIGKNAIRLGHEAYQWPEGIAQAANVLVPWAWEQLGLDPTTVVYVG